MVSWRYRRCSCWLVVPAWQRWRWHGRDSRWCRRLRETASDSVDEWPQPHPLCRQRAWRIRAVEYRTSSTSLYATSNATDVIQADYPLLFFVRCLLIKVTGGPQTLFDNRHTVKAPIICVNCSALTKSVTCTYGTFMTRPQAIPEGWITVKKTAFNMILSIWLYFNMISIRLWQQCVTVI